MGGVNHDASERAISRRTQDRVHQLESSSQDVINHSRFPQMLDKPTRVINLPMISREHYLQSLVHISSEGLREYTVRGTKQSVQYGGGLFSMGCWWVYLVWPILSLVRMQETLRSLSQLDGHTFTEDLRLLSLLVPIASHSSFHLCFTLDRIIGYQSLNGTSALDASRAAAAASLSALSFPSTPTCDGHQQK